MRKLTVEDFLDRFEVNVDTQCWEWTGPIGSHGYGTHGGNSGRNLSHMLAYEMWNGVIPEGYDVSHHCDNRPCINPDHLFVGTRQDNMRDAVSKGRQAKGRDFPGTKLNEDLVREIRGSSESQYLLAERFQVGQPTISRIQSRKSWKHVEV